MAVHANSLATAMHLMNLFEQGNDTDFIVRYDGEKELKVHKLIISRCRFFARAIQGDFKEASTGTISMHQDPAHAVLILIRHLYGYAYPTSAVSKHEEAMQTVEVYALAEKCGVMSLKEKAQAAFNNLPEIYAKQDSSKFASLAIEVYTTTIAKDRGLRDTIARSVCWLKAALSVDDAAKECILELFETCPQLGYDFFLHNPKTYAQNVWHDNDWANTCHPASEHRQSAGEAAAASSGSW